MPRGLVEGDLWVESSKAIFCEGSRANTVEARTRNFLRRTGGLRRVRGNTSPLVDCPISAAWWRYRVAFEASSIAQREGSDLAVDAAHETLRTRDVWDYLVGMSLRQVTSVCASPVRSLRPSSPSSNINERQARS